MIELVIDRLMPNDKIFSYIMARTSYNQWDDDEVSFVLDQLT